MSAPLRTAVHLAAALMSLGVMLLGAAWLADRAHRWERPAWRHPSFVRLRGVPAAPSHEPVWVVAVNPRCPHCLAALARLRAEWARCGRQEDLVSLVVDTPARPDAGVVAALCTSQVWWDRRGVWRRRWGHRLYGELMQFDGDGRLVRSAPAFDVRNRPGPCDVAPVHREGGS
jgi:hypothetical protein